MVYLGATDSSSPEVTYSVLYTEIIIYPDWNSKNMQHDIALIKIPAVSFSKRIQPIALPSIIGTYSTYAGDYAIASGWGRTSDTASGNTEELQWARMQVISNTECADTFGAKITSSVICVSTTGGVSTCNGDSGGPLVLESTQELIGLTSFGAIAGCGWGYPAAFTRLTSYLGWIQSNTGIYYYH